MTDPTAKISIRALVKRFGAKTVLDGLDLDVRPGESVVVIGGSGSGKSVLIKTVIGLLQPDSGQIAIDGVMVAGARRSRRAALNRAAINRKIGMLFQGAALFDSLNVWENVAFGLIRAHGMGRDAARRKALQALAGVGIGAGFARHYPAGLSAGMQKRVGLARAVAADPEIVFFDEPTTGIDPVMGGIVDDLIVRRVRETGATALTITHDMDSARRIADRIALLYRGRLVWNGTPADLDRTAEPHIRQFVTGAVDGPIVVGARQ